MFGLKLLLLMAGRWKSRMNRAKCFRKNKLLVEKLLVRLLTTITPQNDNGHFIVYNVNIFLSRNINLKKIIVMKRRTIATIIIILTFLFPFRYAFLEEFEYKMVNGFWVEQHSMYHMFNFLLVVAAAMFFIYVMNDDSKKETRMKKLQHAEISKSKAVA